MTRDQLRANGPIGSPRGRAWWRRVGLARLVGAVLVLTVALTAGAADRAEAATPVQKAEACIRTALRKETLAIGYIKEGTLRSETIAFNVIGPAIDELKCAVNATRAAGALDEISTTESRDVRADLDGAITADVRAHIDIRGASGAKKPDPHAAIVELESATASKHKALAGLETAKAPPPTTAAPSVGPISAVFVPKKLATLYTVDAKASGETPLTFRWTLTLKQIDDDGSAPAGYQSSNPKAPLYSSAGFDPTCDNSLLPGGDQTSDSEDTAVYVWSGLSTEFTWYHGDKGSYPGSDYGCDHTKMGARGHQGIVTVEVSEGGWVCTASIDGTNLSQVTEHGPPASCKHTR